MLRVLACVAMVAACRGTAGELGGACAFDRDCSDSGAHCFERTCRLRGSQGQACRTSRDCSGDLRCVADRCLVEADARKEWQQEAARAAAATRKARADEEARLLAESGIASTEPTVERGALPAGPGATVRVVTTTAKETAFAACRAEERLVGGGCKGDFATHNSFPSGHSSEDTVGARWNCTTGGQVQITSYALCQKLK
jgi:hypothetical protein